MLLVFDNQSTHLHQESSVQHTMYLPDILYFVSIWGLLSRLGLYGRLGLSRFLLEREHI